MKTLKVALGLLVVATVACSSLETTTDYDRAADFSKYKTFAFQEGTPVSTSFIQQRIEAAISSALQSKGLRPAPGADSADLLVFTHAKTSTEKQLNATTMGYSGWWGGGGWYGGGWGGYGGYGGGMSTTTVQEVDIKKGTVIVDLVDRGSQKVVWRGSATNVISESSGSPEKLNAGATKLFEGFPPAPGAAPAK